MWDIMNGPTSIECYCLHSTSVGPVGACDIINDGGPTCYRTCYMQPEKATPLPSA